MLNVATFDENYPSQVKGWGHRDPFRVTGTTLVVQMDPEDLHMIDDTHDWASEANDTLATRTVENNDENYWGHIRTLEGLHHAMQRGWGEGTDKIVRLADAVRDKIPHPYGSRRAIRWSDQGDMIDMAKVYQGNLDRAWRSSPRQRERAPRVISLDVDVGQNCMVGADDLFWSGAAAVALTDALEDAGYRVELFATSTTHFEANGKRHVGLARFRAKRAHERVNPALVAALVAMPATFRWYHLQSWTKHPHHIGWGFGRSGTIAPALEAAMKQGLLDGAEVAMDNSLSEEAAVAEVTAAIERLTEAEASAEGTIQ